MLKHGENIVDMIGAEIDRIEKELKVTPVPTARHSFMLTLCFAVFRRSTRSFVTLTWKYSKLQVQC